MAEVAKTVELTDEEKRNRLNEHYESIKDMETFVKECEHEVLNLTFTLKCAKKQFDGAVSQLRTLIGRDPLYVPPAVADPQLKLDFEAAYDERLKAPISEAIQLTEKQIEKLIEAGVKTVGEFEKLRGGQMKDYPNGLADLERVGQSTIDKWEQQILEWLKVTPEPTVQSQPAESDTPEVSNA